MGVGVGMGGPAILEGHRRWHGMEEGLASGQGTGGKKAQRREQWRGAAERL